MKAILNRRERGGEKGKREGERSRRRMKTRFGEETRGEEGERQAELENVT